MAIAIIDSAVGAHLDKWTLDWTFDVIAIMTQPHKTRLSGTQFLEISSLRIWAGLKSKCEKKLSSWFLAKNKVLMTPPTEKKQAKLEEYGFTMASVRKSCPVDAWLRIKY